MSSRKQKIDLGEETRERSKKTRFFLTCFYEIKYHRI